MLKFGTFNEWNLYILNTYQILILVLSVYLNIRFYYKIVSEYICIITKHSKILNKNKHQGRMEILDEYDVT